jgi:CRISPR/Cas system CMR-associated protein Cmr5 small subunit
LLNERSSNKKEKGQISALRTLFKYEIDVNLELLERFYKKIKNDTIQNEPINYTTYIANSPLPHFNILIWEKQNYLLTLAFTESEIKNIQYFYNQIISLKVIYNHIQNGIPESEKEIKIRFVKSSEIRIPYYHYFQNDSAEFMKISEKLIKLGNPLNK